MRSCQDAASNGGASHDADYALAQRLDEALADLPEQTRSAVLRKYGEGLSYSEISADTGVAVSALKMRVARGAAQLRHALVGAGITIATVALIFASHARETRQPRTVTVVACDTLRAMMNDTLGTTTSDSLLPPERCDERAYRASHRQQIRGEHPPQQKPEF
jgi:hypothetical protein